jgi:hypothetical protein
MAEWRVNLEGDEFDLEQLAALLATPRQRLRKEERHFVLTSDRFNTLTDADSVRKTAVHLTDTLFGLARLTYGARIPFRVGSLRWVEDNGRTNYYLSLESVSITIRGGAPESGAHEINDHVPPGDPSIDWVSLSESDESVSRVLRLYGKAADVWNDLYPIYEIIQLDMGGESAIVSSGWTSANEIARFTRTAGQPYLAEDRPKDSGATVEPPSKEMTHVEGKEFVESLLNPWLKMKHQSRDS